MEQSTVASSVDPGCDRPTQPELRGGVGAAVALTSFGALVAGVAAVGAAASGPSRMWYLTLRKPGFQPPAAVFPIVWTGLYALTALSGWRVWRRPRSTARSRALALWNAQLALNGAYTWLFFDQHRTGAALADTVALLGAVSGYAAVARRVDRLAAWMVAPYIAWCAFASALGAEIVRLNPGRR